MIGVIIATVTTIGAAFTSAVAAAGPALAAIAGSIKTIAFGSGSLGITDILFIVRSIVDIAKQIGIIGDENSSEELGAKALQADKQPDEFVNTKKYIEYLRNEVILDRDVLDNKSEAELIAYKVIGAGIALKAVEESICVVFSPTFLQTAAKSSLNSNEILGIAKACGSNGMTSTFLIDNYMNNKVSLDEKMKIGDIIIDGLKEVNPSMKVEDAEERLTEMELKYDRG